MSCWYEGEVILFLCFHSKCLPSQKRMTYTFTSDMPGMSNMPHHISPKLTELNCQKHGTSISSSEKLMLLKRSIQNDSTENSINKTIEDHTINIKVAYYITIVRFS